MSLTRLKARILISECRGNEIWSVETCRSQSIPEQWIQELADTFESGFRTDRETIYENDRVTNQYHGVRDLALAYKLAEFLGVNTTEVTAYSLGWESEIRALQEAVEEM